MAKKLTLELFLYNFYPLSAVMSGHISRLWSTKNWWHRYSNTLFRITLIYRYWLVFKKSLNCLLVWIKLMLERVLEWAQPEFLSYQSSGSSVGHRQHRRRRREWESLRWTRAQKRENIWDVVPVMTLFSAKHIFRWHQKLMPYNACSVFPHITWINSFHWINKKLNIFN